MDRKLWKIAGAAVLAGSPMTMGPAMAQGQSQPPQFEQQRANDSDRAWGWLGLIGLLGLAGLRRRRDPDLHRDTTSAKPGYNR